MKDWKEIFSIENAINEKELRTMQVNKLMANVRRGKW